MREGVRDGGRQGEREEKCEALLVLSYSKSVLSVANLIL